MLYSHTYEVKIYKLISTSEYFHIQINDKLKFFSNIGNTNRNLNLSDVLN
jgi:hypothetical protein